jgi:hypothetical protein
MRRRCVLFAHRQAGHSYELTVGQFGTPILEGRLRLLTGVVYTMPLATGDVPLEYVQPRGHTYDLDTMSISERQHRST